MTIIILNIKLLILNAYFNGKNAMTMRILGTGSYVPERIVTNDDLAQIVETSDEWISTRTGIHERRISQGEGTSRLAA